MSDVVKRIVQAAHPMLELIGDGQRRGLAGGQLVVGKAVHVHRVPGVLHRVGHHVVDALENILEPAGHRVIGRLHTGRVRAGALPRVRVHFGDGQQVTRDRAATNSPNEPGTYPEEPKRGWGRS